MRINFLFNDIPSYLETSIPTLSVGNNSIDLSHHESNIDSRLFYKFSNQCNMRCEYCFQSEEVKNMPIEPRMLIERLRICEEYFKESSYDRVLFGGEPFIESNLPYLKWLIEETDHNYYAFTNGAFNARMSSFITANINRFKAFIITIDGPEYIHNKRRAIKGINGFKLIIENIKVLIDCGLDLILQTNVDSGNYESTQLLLEYLENELSISKENIIFSLNPVLHCIDNSDELELLENGIKLMKEYGDTTININSTTLQKLEKFSLGNGVSRNRCTIGYDIVADFTTGEFYTCSQSALTSIGVLKNKVSIDTKKQDYYKLANNKSNDSCLKCDLAFFCSYGCYLDSKYVDGINCKIKIRKALELILNNISVFFDLED